MKAINIQWDIDSNEKDIDLPLEIEIPDGMNDEDEISDYISESTGFCHKGYDLLSDTEYAVEIHNNNGFVRQIDVFNNYEEALNCCRNYSYLLLDDEYLTITVINYDKNGNETGIEGVVYYE